MRHSGPLPECGRGCAHGSNRSTALNNVDQDDRECDYQENMNETTECVGRYDSQQPENQQNHKDCPEHLYSFRRPMPLPSLMQFGGLLSVATSPSLIRCPRLLICEADLRSCRGLIQRLPLVPAACDFQLHELLCAGFEYLSSRRRVHSSAMIHAEPNKDQQPRHTENSCKQIFHSFFLTSRDLKQSPDQYRDHHASAKR
jgi:hypothetical protein